MLYYTPIHLRALINNPPLVFTSLEALLCYLPHGQPHLWTRCVDGVVAVVQQPTGMLNLPITVIRYAPHRDLVLLGYLSDVDIDTLVLPQWDPLNHVMVEPSLSTCVTLR